MKGNSSQIEEVDEDQEDPVEENDKVAEDSQMNEGDHDQEDPANGDDKVAEDSQMDEGEDEQNDPANGDDKVAEDSQMDEGEDEQDDTAMEVDEEAEESQTKTLLVVYIKMIRTQHNKTQLVQKLSQHLPKACNVPNLDNINLIVKPGKGKRKNPEPKEDIVEPRRSTRLSNLPPPNYPPEKESRKRPKPVHQKHKQPPPVNGNSGVQTASESNEVQVGDKEVHLLGQIQQPTLGNLDEKFSPFKDHKLLHSEELVFHDHLFKNTLKMKYKAYVNFFPAFFVIPIIQPIVDIMNLLKMIERTADSDGRAVQQAPTWRFPIHEVQAKEWNSSHLYPESRKQHLLHQNHILIRNCEPPDQSKLAFNDSTFAEHIGDLNEMRTLHDSSVVPDRTQPTGWQNR
ncbi:hypothetical protein C8J55DRAFT_493843 [Lentinula edodes]|uniref:Uncharacterized protein n=1 Tax=Lentinula lateritia TaxID=40482 RepID=A0A9W9DDZ5_9AGAR|nr:hypothetical protein C8J55DRAFT_493843 [Lentinula edodes]